MFQRILVSLDGSASAEYALSWAVTIARHAEADVELVHENALYALNEPAVSGPPFGRNFEWQQQDRGYLDVTADWLARSSLLPVRTAMVKGLEAGGILEQIQQSDVDLVIMAVNGRGPIGRRVQGSVTDALIRQAAVPVLLVHGAADATTAGHVHSEPCVENILIPVDGAALAEQALEPAFSLGRLMGSRCTFLRVITPPNIPVRFAPRGGRVPAREQTCAANDLDGMAELARRHDLEVHTRVIVATDPASAILESAGASDLIALGTHGFAGPRRMLPGSVADQVIRGTSSAVLVYRPRDQ